VGIGMVRGYIYIYTFKETRENIPFTFLNPLKLNSIFNTLDAFLARFGKNIP
jgi:hypothetical protein